MFMKLCKILIPIKCHMRAGFDGEIIAERFDRLGFGYKPINIINNSYLLNNPQSCKKSPFMGD